MKDLKPANLLIGQDGILRIADFGQARPLSKEGKGLYTPQVATRWYRAPELLYGSRRYTEAMDLWAAGCIIAEAFCKMPLFPVSNPSPVAGYGDPEGQYILKCTEVKEKPIALQKL